MENVTPPSPNKMRIIQALGETGFEPATSASRTQRSGQTELLPGKHDFSTSVPELQATIN